MRRAGDKLWLRPHRSLRGLLDGEMEHSAGQRQDADALQRKLAELEERHSAKVQTLASFYHTGFTSQAQVLESISKMKKYERSTVVERYISSGHKSSAEPPASFKMEDCSSLGSRNGTERQVRERPPARIDPGTRVECEGSARPNPSRSIGAINTTGGGLSRRLHRGGGAPRDAVAMNALRYPRGESEVGERDIKSDSDL
ncbi:Sorting nexin-29 [Liparis tanakae]|uniref:Sorting nexin-29 n=1 Tax=Liparis tanakae TaxID=230148 RepID=A0A4Z2EEH7_9TELE|nr:Sorting nexin-29 [Liparis tanakae]